MGKIWPLFRLFSSFTHSNFILTIQIEKSADGVLGIRTQGLGMVGAD